MSIVRYYPNDFVPATFSSLVDRFFTASSMRAGGSVFTPKVDVIESETSYEVQVAVPGLNKEDFKIEINETYLTISGERKFINEHLPDSKTGTEKNFRSIETNYGSFSRSFTLPDNADGSKISAKYNNGILELLIPKDEKKIVKQVIKVA